MADAEGLCELIERHDGWITSSPLEIAQILLAESGTRPDLLLRQALFPTQARKVPANQFAHIHAQLMAVDRNEVYQL